jgi:hypothetical protein
MKSELKIFFLMIIVSIPLSCGVNIVRKVTFDAHRIVPIKGLKTEKIAVIEKTAPNQQALGAAEIMSITLRKHGFNVMEQTNVDAVLRKYKITISDERDLKQIQKAGKVLKADKILIVSIADFTKGHEVVPRGCMSSPSIETYVHMAVVARLSEIKIAEIIWTGTAITQDINTHVCLKRISEKFAQSLSD